MSRTYTKFRNDIAKQCNISTDDTTAMITIDSYLNDSIRTMCNLQGGKLRFLESTKVISSVASQESYLIPNKYRKIIDVYFTVGVGQNATIYMPEMVFDPTKWKMILAYRLGTNDFPYFCYVENQRIRFQPIPASTGNEITIRGRLTTIDLSIPDYTTGNISSIVSDGTVVTGSGTAWTIGMIGQSIMIPHTSAANGGDGLWYEIADVTSATSLTLLKNYEGTSISGGSASYTIGQTSVLPEAYDVGVVDRSSAQFWDNQNDLLRGKVYWMRYDGGMEAGYNKDYGGLMLQMLSNEGETEEGAYIPPFGKNNGNIMMAPYYFPYQLATGFN